MRPMFHFKPNPDAPIVCDFTDASDTPDERFAEFRRLFEAGGVSNERTEDGMILTLAPDEDIADWVVDLAAREAACCPFLQYDVTADDNEVRWIISGATAAQPILDEYHALFETG